MPRDGSNVYHIPPGTEGVPDTVIESAKYNTFIADVEQDFNTARPIIAGGTGATNTDAALVALGAEKANQIVTNFDSQVFMAGSFSSAASATGSPVASHAFAGIVYVADSSNLVVEARDLDDTAAPPRMYIRQKKAGVWGAWAPDFDQTAQNTLNDGRYVNTTGDAMSGLLLLSANPAVALGAATRQYVDSGDVAAVASAVASANATADAAYVKLAGNQNLTGGFSATTFPLGTISSGTVTPSPMNGNYQYMTNNGAFTLAIPALDCAIDLLVTNGASAGAITFSSFTVNAANTGDSLTTTNGHRFIISIRRMASVSTYVIKALQ